jgi:hypothetical protein
MELTRTQIDAAQLLFEDRTTDQAIADQLKIDTRTLRRWRDIPEFIDLLSSLRQEFIEQTNKRLLATREARLASKMDRHRLLTEIIRQRAAADDPSIPGADTGLLVKRTTQTKAGETIEYRVDHNILRELSRLEADIARELGQDKPVIAEPAEEHPEQDLTCLTNDELDIMIMICTKIAKHNPWMIGPAQQELTEFQIMRTERLIQNQLEQRNVA